MASRNAGSRVWGIVLLTIFTLAGTAYPAGSEELLTVRNVADPSQAEMQFDAADLAALPQVTIRTRTDYTDGVVEFVGPLARDVLASFEPGAATTIHLVAANDYSFDIPLSDLTQYDVILAMQADGKRLSIRDKGPIWLMYPLDDFAELKDPKYNLRLIWQLTTMEIR